MLRNRAARQFEWLAGDYGKRRHQSGVFLADAFYDLALIDTQHVVRRAYR